MIQNLVYALLGVNVVSAETPSVAGNIISTAGEVTTGIVSEMGTFGNFLTTNSFMVLILAVGFTALASRYIARWIVSLRLG